MHSSFIKFQITKYFCQVNVQLNMSDKDLYPYPNVECLTRVLYILQYILYMKVHITQVVSAYCLQSFICLPCAYLVFTCGYVSSKTVRTHPTLDKQARVPVQKRINLTITTNTASSLPNMAPFRSVLRCLRHPCNVFQTPLNIPNE